MKVEAVDLRGRLIAEAEAMLSAGIADLSLRGVAKAAGVSAMAPYRHFPDKAALLAAVAQRGFDEMRDVLVDADAGSDGGRAALVEQGLAYVGFAQGRPDLFRLMFGRGGRALDMDAGDNAAFAVLAGRVAEVMPDERQAWTLGCWALVHGMAMLSLDGRVAAGTAEIRSMLTLLIRDE